jgi:hypothetical protein
MTTHSFSSSFQRCLILLPGEEISLIPVLLALKTIKERNPEVDYTLVTLKNPHPLLSEVPWITEILSLWKDIDKISQRCQKKWDYLFNWSQSPKTAYFASTCPAKVKIGYTCNDQGEIILSDGWSMYLKSQNFLKGSIHLSDCLTTQMMSVFELNHESLSNTDSLDEVKKTTESLPFFKNSSYDVLIRHFKDEKNQSLLECQLKALFQMPTTLQLTETEIQQGYLNLIPYGEGHHIHTPHDHFVTHLKSGEHGGGCKLISQTIKMLSQTQWSQMISDLITKEWLCGWSPPLVRETLILSPELINHLRQLKESVRVADLLNEQCLDTCKKTYYAIKALKAEHVFSQQQREELKAYTKKLIDLDHLMEQVSQQHTSLESITEKTSLMLKNTLYTQTTLKTMNDTFGIYKVQKHLLSKLMEWIDISLLLTVPRPLPTRPLSNNM